MISIVGIDPGFYGAISCIFGDGRIEVINTPIYKTVKVTQKSKKTKSEYDIRLMLQYLNNVIPCKAYIEKSQSFPGQGVVAMHSLGYGFGLWVGMLAALKIPYEIVSPKTWQKEFFTGKAGETKKLSYKVASALFPNLELTTPRGRIIDGKCDSILICEYGRRRQNAVS